jgi:hypothetical protein
VNLHSSTSLRPAYSAPAGSVARLRYTAKSGVWTLYWNDRNGRWHRYDLIEPTPDIRVLLDEVDRDPTCIFWG